MAAQIASTSLSAKPKKTSTPRKTPARRRSRVAGAEAGRLLRRAPWIYMAGLAFLHLLLAYLAIEPAPHTGGDNAGYLTLAKSLLQHGTYQDLFDPTQPPHTQYPPVFPAILAIASLIGLKSWLHLKYLTVAFSALAVAFTYLWIRRSGRPELAFGIAMLIAISPGVVHLAHWELSDVPFWAMSMVALWAWDRLRPGDYKMLAVAVTMTVLAYFTRSAGLPLLIAAGGWLIWKRRWQQLVIFAAVMIPLAFLWWLRARMQGGVDYVGQFWFVDPYQPALGRIDAGQLIDRMAANGGKYITQHFPILLFGAPRYIALSVIIVVLGVYGWFRRMRRPRVSDLFLPLYIGLLLIWPAVWSGERFLLPAMPLILYYAGDGIVRLFRMVEPASARLMPALLAAILILLGLPQLAAGTQLGRECMGIYRMGDRYACLPAQWKDFFGIAEVTPRILPDSAVVLNRKARTFYIVSGLRGRNYPLSAEPDSFFKEVRETGARYVLFDRLDGLSQAYLAPVLVARSNSFCMLFGLGQDRAILFGILPGAERIAAPPVQGSASFADCGPEFWRSTAARDSLQQGLIPMQ